MKIFLFLYIFIAVKLIADYSAAQIKKLNKIQLITEHEKNIDFKENYCYITEKRVVCADGK